MEPVGHGSFQKQPNSTSRIQKQLIYLARPCKEASSQLLDCHNITLQKSECSETNQSVRSNQTGAVYSSSANNAMIKYNIVGFRDSRILQQLYAAKKTLSCINTYQQKKMQSGKFIRRAEAGSSGHRSQNYILINALWNSVTATLSHIISLFFEVKQR